LSRTASTLNGIIHPMDCWSNLHIAIQRTGSNQLDHLDMESIMERTQTVIMENIITTALWLEIDIQFHPMVGRWTDGILEYKIGHVIKNSSKM
jgi:hypothetical protein